MDTYQFSFHQAPDCHTIRCDEVRATTPPDLAAPEDTGATAVGRRARRNHCAYCNVAAPRPACLSIVILFTFLPATRAGAGADGGDTLRFYLSKSQLVIAGEIVSEPSSVTLDFGASHFTADFRIDEVIKGSRLAKEKIHVEIVRHDLESKLTPRPEPRAGERVRWPDWPVELKRGGKCILFLDAKGITVDPWFGIQPHYPTMIKALKQVADEQAAQQK